jgi:hypothetical protein
VATASERGVRLVGPNCTGILGGVGDGWSDGPNFDSGLLGVAAIPVTIGLAFIVLSFFNKNKD